MLGSIAIIFVIGVAMQSVPKNSVPSNLFGMLGIIAVAGINWNLYRTQCPNCSKPMGGTAFWIMRAQLGGMNNCPHCAVSLDKQ
ncbi:MAG: hypothetical protein QOF32_1450, partial [Gammaproteobacteria bacterium]|nr:hypothetical protein [Gammaproteobacteria bacterium]